MTNPLTRLQELFRILAQELIEVIEIQPNSAGWTNAVLDVRYSEDRSAWFKKIDATIANLCKSMKGGSDKMTEVLYEIGQPSFGEPFYGFMVSVTPQGAVEIKLNYDPNAFEDPTFWE